MTNRNFKYQKGQGMLALILLVVIIGAFFLAGGSSYKSQKINNPESENTTVETASTEIGIASGGTPACSHFDGVCHPQTQLSCCTAGSRVLCSSGKCTGVLPPADPNLVDPSPTINPSCATLDSVCAKACGEKEGFTCF